MSDRRPHVCFVAPNAFPVLSGAKDLQVIGGAEVQQVIVAKGLAQRGYRVSMVCLDFGQDAITDIDGIRVFRAYRPDAGVPVVRFLWPRIANLWSGMERASADIYYQRTAGMITGLVAAFCKWHGKKSIFAASGNPNFDRNTPRIRYRRDRWIYEYGLRHVDRILVQNAEQADLCRANFGRPSTLVPNCYPMPAEQLEANRDEVLWVGSIRPLKRPELFLSLAQSLPNLPFRMIGGASPGHERLYKEIEARAEALPNLEFTGFVPYSQVDSYFDRAALLVNTSGSEGFPNTFLQAWARGVVTVSFVDSGARLKGHPVGRIVDTLESMSTEVATLMQDEERRSKQGVGCRDYFVINHGPEPVLDLYEAIFAELTAPKPPQARRGRETTPVCRR